MPVFTRSSFHLEWTHLPHFSSSIVLKHGPIGDTGGPVYLTVVFLEKGNGIKKPKKGSNSEPLIMSRRGRGSGGEGGGGEGFLIRPPCAPPPTPSSHSPAPPSSNPLLFVSCCDLFVAPSPFIFEVVTILCSVPLSLIITSDNCGETPSMGTGLRGPLHVHTDGRE